jgi:hypothetical protein
MRRPPPEPEPKLKFRKGDVVIVHAEVAYDDDEQDSTLLHLYVNHRSLVVNRDDVKGIFARKWSPGDRVRRIDIPSIYGDVIATHDDQVWVARKDAGFAIETAVWNANSVELLPPPETIEEIMPEIPRPAPPKPDDEEIIF